MFFLGALFFWFIINKKMKKSHPKKPVATPVRPKTKQNHLKKPVATPMRPKTTSCQTDHLSIENVGFIQVKVKNRIFSSFLQ